MVLLNFIVRLTLMNTVWEKVVLKRGGFVDGEAVATGGTTPATLCLLPIPPSKPHGTSPGCHTMPRHDIKGNSSKASGR